MVVVKKIGIVFAFLILMTLLGSACSGSGGISFEEDAKLSPSPPSHVTATTEEDNIHLSWLGTGDDRIRYYRVYRKTEDTDWQLLAKVNTEGDNRGTYEYWDRDAGAGITYLYGVSAVNRYRKESSIAESQPIPPP